MSGGEENVGRRRKTQQVKPPKNESSLDYDDPLLRAIRKVVVPGAGVVVGARLLNVDENAADERSGRVVQQRREGRHGRIGLRYRPRKTGRGQRHRAVLPRRELNACRRAAEKGETGESRDNLGEKG